MAEDYLTSWLTSFFRPGVVVVGNEKGGSGKSTLAIHLAMGLVEAGLRVGTVDLDGRQGTFSRFIENRKHYNETVDKPVPLPRHSQITLSRNAREHDAGDEKLAQLVTALESLAKCQVIVVDTPGSDHVLCRAAHVVADILITPLNSSFLDLDALVQVDEEARLISGPSAYSEMVLFLSEKRVELGGTPIDWSIIVNRVPNVDTRVHRSVMDILEQLSQRLRFNVLSEIHDRVVFRELFPQGLTVLDVADADPNAPPGRNYAAARGEVDALVDEVLARGPWAEIAEQRAQTRERPRLRPPPAAGEKAPRSLFNFWRSPGT